MYIYEYAQLYTQVHMSILTGVPSSEQGDASTHGRLPSWGAGLRLALQEFGGVIAAQGFELGESGVLGDFSWEERLI